MVGGRKGSEGGSKRLLSQEAVSMATRGVLSSLEEGLPSRTAPPSELGKPPVVRPWGPEFRVGQEGVNGSPPLSFTCSPKSRSAALGPERSRGCPRGLTYAYSHPTPGLYSHARPRRAPRTQRTPSCLTSRTTHAPPQCGVESSQRRVADNDSGAHVDPSTELAVWCDFDIPIHIQGHKQF